MDQSQRVLEQLATRSLGSNPAQGQAAQGMSAEDEAQEGDQTELPADKPVVYLTADNAQLRTKQRMFLKENQPIHSSDMEDDASPLPMAKRRKTMPAPKTPPDSFPPFSDEFSNWCLRLRQPVPLIVIDDPAERPHVVVFPLAVRTPTCQENIEPQTQAFCSSGVVFPDWGGATPSASKRNLLSTCGRVRTPFPASSV